MPKENKQARQQAVAESFQWKPDAGAYNVPGYDKTRQQIGDMMGQRMAQPGVQIDTQPQGQVRDNQAAFVQALQQQAAGQGPSMADVQAQRAMQAARANASSMAASASGQGVSPALAAALAGRQTEAATNDIAGQAIQGRIAEQMGAQQTLGQALSGMREQDIGLAGQQAGVGLQNQGQIDDMVKAYMGLGLSYDQAQAQAQMAYQQQQGQMAMQMRDINANLAGAQQAQKAATRNAWIGGAFGATGALGSAAIEKSDERAKTEINREQTPEKVREFLDALDTASWKYKQPEKDGEGKRYGVMAQSVAKSDVGRTFVVQMDDGHLGIDTKKGFGAVLAAAKDLHERLKHLESLTGKAVPA